MTDALGIETKYVYDAVDRLPRMIEEYGRVVWDGDRQA
jgi:hypothetical protein